MSKILLLVPTSTYRAHDLLAAASRLQVEVVVGSEVQQALEPETAGTTLTVDLADPPVAALQIEAYHRRCPLVAIVGLDDETTLVAAVAAERLGFRHNSVQAVAAASSKSSTRLVQQRSGLPCPDFFLADRAGGADKARQRVGYPCVLKPTFLSASRGVIRADNDVEFRHAFDRIGRLLEQPEIRRRGGSAASEILIERYVPGAELALEGILTGGDLQVLALFDKPDPLEGPFFEETLYVTPSRLSGAHQQLVAKATAELAAALGLAEGPIHAEIRLDGNHATVLELAPRAIGGLCSRVLRFGADVSLSELILRHALGEPIDGLRRENQASGVMMIPIPRAGILHAVEGVEQAESIAQVEHVVISTHRGQAVVPLPEGNQYLGFIFARAAQAATVETALRQAHACLRFEIA